jgi:hypothetical protein
MINSILERQAKRIDELLGRLIEERDGKKLDASSANPSSSTCAVSFTQTNPYITDPSRGWYINAKPLCPASEPLSQPNHHRGFNSYSWDATSNYNQHIWARVYTHRTWLYYTKPPGLAPYTSRYNSLPNPNPNSSYQASYTTVAYTDPIPFPGSLLDFLPNHAYQNTSCFNAYGQSKACGFGFETPPQFPFRS